MLSIDPTAEQAAFASAITSVLSKRALEAGPPPQDLWRELGGLGVLGVSSSHVGGDSSDAVAAMRAVGAAGLQGSVLGALLAARVLVGDDRSAAAAQGTITVGVVEDGLAAWSADAELLIEIQDGVDVSVVEAVDVEPIETVAGEPWARVRTRTIEGFGPRPVDVAVAELARAAWMIGAAESVLALASEHASGRIQFGRPIGEFQAVAHPLAEAAADAGAAGDAVALAALRLERLGDIGPVWAAGHAATSAALTAAFASHQAHGAIGFTTERGLDRYTVAIRQFSLHPPSPDTRRALIAREWLP